MVLEEALCDKSMQIALESDARAINWSLTPRSSSSSHSSSPPLVPSSSCLRLLALKTPSDHNCLCHSAALAMWGVTDRQCTIRAALLACLESSSASALIRSRWEAEEKRRMEADGYSMTTDQMTREWQQELSLLRNRASLHELHAFVLAHILRRPIVVFADSVVKDAWGNPAYPCRFGGVYLPLLLSSSDCCHTPIFLGYEGSHFSALVFSHDWRRHIPLVGEKDVLKSLPSSAYSSSSSASRRSVALPPVRFLTKSEESNVRALLEEWMPIQELDLPSSSSAASPHGKYLCVRLDEQVFTKQQPQAAEAQSLLFESFVRSVEQKQVEVAVRQDSRKRDAKSESNNYHHQQLPPQHSNGGGSVHNSNNGYINSNSVDSAFSRANVFNSLPAHNHYLQQHQQQQQQQQQQRSTSPARAVSPVAATSPSSPADVNSQALRATAAFQWAMVIMRCCSAHFFVDALNGRLRPPAIFRILRPLSATELNALEDCGGDGFVRNPSLQSFLLSDRAIEPLEGDPSVNIAVSDLISFHSVINDATFERALSLLPPAHQVKLMPFHHIFCLVPTRLAVIPNLAIELRERYPFAFEDNGDLRRTPLTNAIELQEIDERKKERERRRRSNETVTAGIASTTSATAAPASFNASTYRPAAAAAAATETSRSQPWYTQSLYSENGSGLNNAGLRSLSPRREPPQHQQQQQNYASNVIAASMIDGGTRGSAVVIDANGGRWLPWPQANEIQNRHQHEQQHHQQSQNRYEFSRGDSAASAVPTKQFNSVTESPQRIYPSHDNSSNNSSFAKASAAISSSDKSFAAPAQEPPSSSSPPRPTNSTIISGSPPVPPSWTTFASNPAASPLRRQLPPTHSVIDDPFAPRTGGWMGPHADSPAKGVVGYSAPRRANESEFRRGGHFSHVTGPHFASQVAAMPPLALQVRRDLVYGKR